MSNYEKEFDAAREQYRKEMARVEKNRKAREQRAKKKALERVKKWGTL